MVTEVPKFLGTGDDGNPILGAAPVKRGVLHFTGVAMILALVWRTIVPHLKVGWVFIEPRSLKAIVPSPFARALLRVTIIMIFFVYTILPYLVGTIPMKTTRTTPDDDETKDMMEMVHQEFGGDIQGEDEDLVVPTKKNDPKFLRQCGVVIPCHKSAKEIGAVLHAVLRYFQAEHVIVVDNANSPEPPDETWEVVRDVAPGIRYIYVAEGLKTRALVHGTLLFPPAVKYVLHLDDDTILSEAMIFDERHFDDPQVSGVTFGIRMLGDSVVATCVDWEFVQFSIQRTFRADFATAFFCHGIIGLWRRDRWLRILSTHPSMPYGEDAWIGTDTLTCDERIAAELRCWCRTQCRNRTNPIESLSAQVGRTRRIDFLSHRAR